jgi:O-acetylserine/cysteine efflux transporter
VSARELTILVGMCVVWGFHYVVLKTGLGAIPPTLYAAMRMTVVAALMAPFLRWRPGRMGPVLLAGLCFGAINYFFLFNGVKQATASAAAIAIELYVPFATIMSIIFLKEKIGPPRLFGIALAFAGVAVVALARDPSAETHIGIGVLLVGCCALTESFGSVLVKRIVSFKPYELLAWFGLIGAICLWPAALIMQPNAIETLKAVDPWLVAGTVAYSAIGASIIGHTIYYWLLQRLPISLVAPSTLLTTLLGVGFSVAFLGEKATWTFALGAVIALIGVAIVLLRPTKHGVIETGGTESVGLEVEPTAAAVAEKR